MPQVSVNYLAELLAGFLVPGKPLANIVSLLLPHKRFLANCFADIPKRGAALQNLRFERH